MARNRLTFMAWVMFAVSGVFFLIPAVQSGDVWALGAAITWLIGVLLFMIDGRSGD